MSILKRRSSWHLPRIPATTSASCYVHNQENLYLPPSPSEFNTRIMYVRQSAHHGEFFFLGCIGTKHSVRERLLRRFAQAYIWQVACGRWTVAFTFTSAIKNQMTSLSQASWTLAWKERILLLLVDPCTPSRVNQLTCSIFICYDSSIINNVREGCRLDACITETVCYVLSAMRHALIGQHHCGHKERGVDSCTCWHNVNSLIICIIRSTRFSKISSWR